MKKILAVIAAGLAALLTLTACGTDNNKDLKDVPNAHPDYIINVENMDGQPNIAVLCIKGVGVMTTTRGGAGAFHLVPRLDAFCATKK